MLNQTNAVRTLLLFLLLHFCALSQRTEAYVKALPFGIYWLPPVSTSAKPDDPKQWSVWKNTHVWGVVARISWEQIQQSPGTFDWTYLDTVNQRCWETGTYYQISVHCGEHVAQDGTVQQFWPSWLITQGCQTVALYDPGTGKEETIPIPWDPVFLSYWNAFITQLGARYDTKLQLHSVQMAGCGRQSSLYFCGNQTDYNWLQNNGGVAQYENAAATIAGYYAAAFPHTPFLWSIGDPIQNVPGVNGYTVFGALSQAASQAYNSGNPWRYGTRNSGYSFSSSGNSNLYFNGDQEIGPFGDSAGPLALQALSQGSLWLECYEGDISDSNNWSDFDQFNNATYNPNQNQ